VCIVDWQTGLVPAFLSQAANPPTTVFTIHNLSYDGYFSYQEFNQLQLPAAWWSSVRGILWRILHAQGRHGIFHPCDYGQPDAQRNHYAGIRHFDGLLQHMGNKLTGILNGIDLDTGTRQPTSTWSRNTARAAIVPGKREIKADLLQLAGLPQSDAPLLGFIGRMVPQKGIDLIAAILPRLFESSDARMVILGSGDKIFESDLMDLAQKHPDRLHVYIGYSEALAHKIEAGCDLFLMPSRYEPCGLNQMYSLRYGATRGQSYRRSGRYRCRYNRSDAERQTANGLFLLPDAGSLLASTRRALKYLANERVWSQLCRTGMQTDLGWETSARQYQKLYQSGVAV
jgi:starch synthase